MTVLRRAAALIVVACATVAGARTPAPLYRLQGSACPGGFGASLAVLGDALVVSGPAADCARVEVFDAATGMPRGALAAVDGTSRIGGAVAASGQTIAVTAANTCTIHLFDGPGPERLAIGTEGLVASDECFFGNGVAVGGGLVAVTGGEVGILVFDVASGTLVATIRPPGAWEEAGPRIAFIGQTLFVGVPGAALSLDGPSRIHAFDVVEGRRRWTTGPPVGSPQLFGIALAADGRSVVVGFWRDGRGREHVALLDAASGRLRRVYISPRRRAGFGSAVAIRGNRVLVGAPDVGRAYLFARRSRRRLATYRVGTRSERGGSAVALGHHIVAVGAPGDGAGSVSVFAAPVE